MMYVGFMKNFLLADSSELMAVRLIFGLLSPKTFDSKFLHMFCGEFVKNFHLADSSELMDVRLNSVSSAQERLINSFYTCSAVSS